ncbi:MAG TPA: ATP-binding protein [Kofleriaceae bacterium]|nr:ATP-binding protein [Kofleriaceae bacterium]
MDARREARERPWWWMLALVMTGLVTSFLLATALIHESSRGVESLALRIVDHTMPRITELAGVRSMTIEVELALARYVEAGPARRAQAVAQVEASLARLNSELAQHVQTTASPGEQQVRAELRDGLVRFNRAVIAAREAAARGDSEEADRQFNTEVLPAGQELLDATVRDIDFHARVGRDLAAEIGAVRARTTALSWAAGLACVALGLAGGTLLWRDARRRRDLVDAHARVLEERAEEFEQFAARVAHDIRNPLSTAQMGAELIRERAGDPATVRLAERVQGGVSRAAEITDGLLQFAMAGARPDPSARTAVRAVIEDLVRAVEPDAERGSIELRTGPVAEVEVACSTGVYLSLVGNLVRNAIKYMGDAAERTIEIRVFEIDGSVRTEVADTGPGVPDQMKASVFEPYFRGSSGRGQVGLGLGLATVKRLAEGHGGRVGVRSRSRGGSTFWFELPRAPAERAAAGDEQPGVGAEQTAPPQA